MGETCCFRRCHIINGRYRNTFLPNIRMRNTFSIRTTHLAYRMRESERPWRDVNIIFYILNCLKCRCWIFNESFYFLSPLIPKIFSSVWANLSILSQWLYFSCRFCYFLWNILVLKLKSQNGGDLDFDFSISVMQKLLLVLQEMVSSEKHVFKIRFFATSSLLLY